MNDAEWIRQNVPQSRGMISFLRTALSNFIEFNKERGRNLTHRTISELISGVSDIQGRISDTTISRFLNPSQTTLPSTQTIRQIAHFLIFENYLSRENIETLNLPPNTPNAARRLNKQTVSLVINTAHWALQSLQSPEGMSAENEELCNSRRNNRPR